MGATLRCHKRASLWQHRLSGRCPFLSLQGKLNSFFLLVSALLSLVQWFVWTLYRVRFVLSFCLFACFPSDGQGWVRWYSCLLMIGFAFLFCLLFRWGILHRMILVVGWCWVLYSSGFLCVNSIWSSLGLVPEKAMATYSSTLAWKIPWTEELGRLQSMGFRRVGHNWETSFSLFTFMH